MIAFGQVNLQKSIAKNDDIITLKKKKIGLVIFSKKLHNN
jgi:hypothetical protein